MSERRKKLFQKQWELVRALQQHPRGSSRRRLLQETAVPSTTLHRYINELRACGVPIATRICNAETWYSLDGPDGGALPPLSITDTQLLALRLARRMLVALDGTRITRELDALLAPHALRDSADNVISVQREPPSAVAVAEVLERAICQRRRARIRVRTRDNPTYHDRIIEPLCLRHSKGDLYVAGFDHTRKAMRKFKLTRIRGAQKLDERASAHPEFDEAQLFEHAVKVGSGEAIDVELRFTPEVAKLVGEYRLVPEQSCNETPDGFVILRARVAGMHEVLRFVLGWGKDVEVLAPEALRARVAQELAAAARQYGEVGVREGEKKARVTRAAGGGERGRERVLPRIVDRG